MLVRISLRKAVSLRILRKLSNKSTHFAYDETKPIYSKDVYCNFKAKCEQQRRFSNKFDVAEDLPQSTCHNLTPCLFGEHEDEKDVNVDDANEQQYQELLSANNLSSFVQSTKRQTCENVLVIHPKVRWGTQSTPKNTTPELQLEEAVALCRTVPGFNVLDAIMIGTEYNTKKKLIWGKGRLYKLLNYKNSKCITAIMINVAILTPLQQTELSAFFQVPVYDRYNVVLSIFKMYAKTREAHLQIALAEIPYIRHRLQYMARTNASPVALQISDANISNGKGENKMDVLRVREHTLRKKISTVLDAKTVECETRRFERGAELHRNCVIAVVGYTNAGKTTLIKKLTGSKTLSGENRLFSTLDTTIHMALLPSRLKIILADTIGFISDLPTQLFASFTATLRHVSSADILIHVQDLSHPNVIAQHDHVVQMLQSLNVSNELIRSMICVVNKLDLIGDEQLVKLRSTQKFLKLESDNNLLMLSCKNGDGVPELIQRIDMNVQRINGIKPRRFKLPVTSKAISHLYVNGLVTEEPSISDCGQYLIFNLLMNDSQIAKFQATTGLKLSLKTVKKLL